MSIKSFTIERYLARYAEAHSIEAIGAWAREVAGSAPYHAAVVVPAFAEEVASLDRLFEKVHRTSGRGRLLCIVVLNEPSYASESQCALNRTFKRDCLARARHLHRVAEGIDLLVGCWPDSAGPTDLLLVDATSNTVIWDHKDGVGRARKWGADLALSLFFLGGLRCSMLGSSDADATLPADYFATLAQEAQPDVAGLVFPFTHQLPSDDRLALGMAQLEASFRYFVLGLHAAGSPFAYHSLGSALAVSLPHYAAVRGFPLRQAGEDFYLLSKLSQVDDLVRLQGEPVQLLTRLSDRVPFGTGPRLAAWSSQETNGETSLLTYDPRVFSVLDQVHTLLRKWSILGQAESEAEVAGGRVFPLALLEARRIAVAVEKSWSQCRGPEQRLMRLFEYFDALSTLRLIRRATKEYFPQLPLQQALERSGLGRDSEALSDPLRMLELLSSLEAKLPRRVGPKAQGRSVDFGEFRPNLPSL